MIYDDSMKKTLTLRYFARNISIVIGLVLVWRGIWYVLDGIDQFVFGGNHAWTAFGGVVLGLIILYLPDKDLKEIEKL
jgi:hypothetical protein